MAKTRAIIEIDGDSTGAERAIGGVSKQAESLSKRIQNISKDTAAFGRNMTTKVTLPIIGAGAAAVKSAIDMESAWTGVLKTVDATEPELAALNEGFKEMARDIPLAIEEIYGIGEAAGQLGIQTQNILGFTEVMAQLGATTNMSSDEAATALARLANITQMPQTEFDRLGATVVDLGNNLATTEREIVEMGLRLAGAGKQVGMTEAQILGLAGALSSVGIEAQMGGSAFSRVMVDIQLAVETGSERLSQFATVAGMTATEFKEAFQKDAASAIVAFVEGIGTAEERGISAIKVLDDMEISEIRLRDALLRAAGAGDLMRESIELGTEAWEENSALTEEAELRFGTTASQMQLLANEVKLTAAAFGEELAPILLEVIESVKPYLEAFREMDAEQKKSIISLAAVAAAAGPVIWALSTIVGAITKLMPLFTALGGVITAIGTGPFALIAAAVAGVSAGVVTLQNKIDSLTGIGEKSKTSLQMLAGALGGQLGIIITIGRYWGDIKELISFNIDLIKEKAVELKERIVDNVQAVIDFFHNLPETIANIVTSVGDWFASLPELIQNGLSAAGQWATQFFVNDLPYWVGYAIGAMIKYFAELPGKLWDKLQETIAKFTEWKSNIEEKAKEAGSNLINRFIDYIKELPGKVWTWLIETANKIPGWANDLYTKAKDAAQELIDGMTDKLDDLPGDVADILWDAAKELLSIGSTFYSYAKQAAESLWNGFKKGIGKSSPSYLERAMFDIQDAARETVRMLQSDFGKLAGMNLKPALEMAGATLGMPGTYGSTNQSYAYDQRDQSQNVTHQHHYTIQITSPEPLNESTIIRKQEQLYREMGLELGVGY